MRESSRPGRYGPATSFENSETGPRARRRLTGSRLRGTVLERVAQASTIFIVTIDLADMDRGVYESFELRVARHPSETGAFMLVRILAYCLEYCDGIEMTAGLSSTDIPALLVRDLTGRVTAWIEVGLPDAERLHRGSKLADRVAVYTHRDVRQLLAQLDGARIHHADAIPIRAFDRTVIEQIADLLDRRTSLALTVSGGDLHVSLGDQMFAVPMTEHRLSQSRS